MLKCIIFMENWIPVSSTGMTRKGSIEMTKKGYLDDIIGIRMTKKEALVWQERGLLG
jgi:hypothetical protein